MVLPFPGSEQPTVGVEIELQIIDPKTRQLAPMSEKILERCRQRGIDRVKAEIHTSMFEIETPICEVVSDCYRELDFRIKAVSAVAKELGLEIMMAGTHPFGHWSNSQMYPHERFAYVSDKFRWLAKRVTVYGMHVHVAVPDGEQALAIANSSLPYLPLLLALSANSPYWQGLDTGLDTCRLGIMNAFPYSGIPKYFLNWEKFSEYLETLIDANAISSLKDIYWHVRPNLEFGTVEFRICDVPPTLSEICALVAFIHNLVLWLMKDVKQHPEHRAEIQERYWFAPENQWMAQRDGLEGMIILDKGEARRSIKQEVLRVYGKLQKTSAAMQNEEAFSAIKMMLEKGNGAKRQRAVYEQTGRMESVVDALVYELAHDQPLRVDPDGQVIDRENYAFMKQAVE